jgi:hypothetical protein
MIDKYYFNEEQFRFFESEDENDLARNMLLLVKNPEIRKNIATIATEHINLNNWSVKCPIYFDIINSLINK